MNKKQIFIIAILFVIVIIIYSLIFFKSNYLMKLDGTKWVMQDMIYYDEESNPQVLNDNITLEINDKKITLCVLKIGDCQNLKYYKENNKYYVSDTNNSFAISGVFEYHEEENMITIINDDKKEYYYFISN